MSRDKSKLLFDPKRHDPVKFSNNHLNKKKSSDGHSLGQSISTTSSTVDDSFSRDHYKDKEKQRKKRRDARSQSSHESRSSNNSNSNSKKSKDEPASAFLVQLKRAYRDIMDTENKLIDERRMAITSSTKISLFGQNPGKSNDDLNWIRLVNKHKSLADAYHSFLATSLAPHTPTSLHALPQKYNIPTRLWQNAFHGLLEKMRSGLNPKNPSSILDHLSDFVYHAYAFYTNLLEEPVLSPFKASWIEALGDLARYRMAVASIESTVSTGNGSSSSPNSLPTTFATPAPPTPFQARVDDSQPEMPPHADVASVGLPALMSGGFDVEDRHLWRQVARDWYGQGLRDMPGTGRLQHHLGVLCRNSQDPDEGLRALYHLCKALTTSHPYPTARETLLGLFDPELQSARKREESVTELFTHAHGLLFTRVELDSFPQAHERLVAHLQAKRASLPDSVWIMMGVVNIASLLQYGQDDSVLKRTAAATDDGAKRQKQLHTSTSNPSLNSGGAFSALSSPVPPVPALPQAIMMHSNNRTGSNPNLNLMSSSPKSSHSLENLNNFNNRPASSASTRSGGGDDDVLLALNKEGVSEEYSTSNTVFEHAQEMTFSIFALLLQKPTTTREGGEGGAPLNPYITIVMTYLTTILKQPTALSLLEKKIPWVELAMCLSRTFPDRTSLEKGAKTGNLNGSGSSGSVANGLPQGPQLSRLVAGTPLPEDWCLRGMEWVGRRVYERGFWKTRTGASSTGASYSGAPPPVSGSAIQSEMDVLSTHMSGVPSGANASAQDGLDGVIESDDDDDIDSIARLRLDGDDGACASSDLDSPLKLAERRLARLAFTSTVLARLVQGFDIVSLDKELGHSDAVEFTITGELQAKMKRWRLAEERKREDELRRLEEIYQHNSDSASDVDSDAFSDISSLSEAISGGENEDEDEELRQLKLRRRELKSLVREQKEKEREAQANVNTSNNLNTLNMLNTIQPSLTTLIFDTNVMLSSIEYVQAFVESGAWVCVVPLAVITELDGISRTDNALGNAAIVATSYLDGAVERSNSLKIQTSKNNFLKDLTMRYEDYGSGGDMDGFEERKTLDDVILDAAKWHKENWMERERHREMLEREPKVEGQVNAFSLNSPPTSPQLSAKPAIPTKSTSKVALITYDRNLRLKSHAAGVTSVDESAFARLYKNHYGNS
ncbi:hypothetical protein E3P96_01090 [Wallemia ichthyophaga]|nr:hypothetical protein E3P96_01090 [Wallemia ichthyophaga]